MAAQSSLSECIQNPPIRDEVWDKCIKRSSIGIGVAGLIGCISTFFVGTGGVVISMSMCITWAIKHCRSLFREQEEAKKKALLELCKQQSRTCPQTTPFPPTPCPQAEPSPIITPCVPAEMKHVKEPPKSCTTEVKNMEIQQQSGSTFPFTPIFPIPDRPFGRSEEESCEDEITNEKHLNCTCDLATEANQIQVNCSCPTDPGTIKQQISNFIIKCISVSTETEIENECTCLPKEACNNTSSESKHNNIITSSKSESEQTCTCEPAELHCTSSNSQPECTCP